MLVLSQYFFIHTKSVCLIKSINKSNNIVIKILCQSGIQFNSINSFLLNTTAIHCTLILGEIYLTIDQLPLINLNDINVVSVSSSALFVGDDNDILLSVSDRNRR